LRELWERSLEYSNQVQVGRVDYEAFDRIDWVKLMNSDTFERHWGEQERQEIGQGTFSKSCSFCKG
jgi:hypothetical protein